MLIDTHCHLNLHEAFPHPELAIEEAQSEGVGALVVIGIDLPSSRIALDLADRFEIAYAAVGIHPNSAAAYSPTDLKELSSMLEHPKAVALGEVGLDFHWDFASPQDQQRLLLDQLDLADDLQVPIVLHCRKAYPELLDLLESRSTRRLLFHCFSGTQVDAARAVTLDAYFGVDGPITYPKATDLREVVRSLPKDRLLIETDAPYLTPAPFRGRPNRPSYVRFVNAGLASALSLSEAECGRMTSENAARLFARLGQHHVGL